MPVAAGQIQIEPDATATVIRMSGEIDASLRDQASRALATALTRAMPVAVDTSAVTFVGAAGIAFLVQCARACKEVRLDFSAEPSCSRVDELIEILGVSETLGREAVAKEG